MKTILLCAVLFLPSIPPLRAQNLEITPCFGYRFGGQVEDVTTGEKYSFKDGRACGLLLDLGPKGSEMKVELLWSRQDSSLDLHGFCTVVESEGAFISHGGATVAQFTGSTMWQGQASVGVSIAFQAGSRRDGSR